MSEETVVDALVESNDLLQEEVTRLRETNAMLRRVNRALRRTLDSLRNQVAAAAENDDTFRRFCDGEFDDQVIETEDAGLAESVSQVEARG
jgi:FtsZ-binding cell division protein ZapB